MKPTLKALAGEIRHEIEHLTRTRLAVVGREPVAAAVIDETKRRLESVLLKYKICPNVRKSSSPKS
jgi:hypothetical protein